MSEQTISTYSEKFNLKTLTKLKNKISRGMKALNRIQLLLQYSTPNLLRSSNSIHNFLYDDSPSLIQINQIFSERGNTSGLDIPIACSLSLLSLLKWEVRFYILQIYF